MNPIERRKRNVGTVQALYQSERDRDIGTWVTLWSSGGRQTFPALGTDATVRGLANLEAVTREKFRVRPDYTIAVVVEAMADPERVFARLEIVFPGQPSAHVWCIFTFCASGLIEEVEELVDHASLQPGIADEQHEQSAAQ